MTGYLSVFGNPVEAGIFSIMLIVTVAVHLAVHRIFIEPSRTLSLVKAVAADRSADAGILRKRKYDQYVRAKREWEACQRMEDGEGPSAGKMALENFSSEFFGTDSDNSPSARRSSETAQSSDQIRAAIARMEDRFKADDYDRLSDLTSSEYDANEPSQRFFIYRQPSLNRATWESRPRPYRQELGYRQELENLKDRQSGPELDFWDC